MNIFMICWREDMLINAKEYCWKASRPSLRSRCVEMAICYLFGWSLGLFACAPCSLPTKSGALAAIAYLFRLSPHMQRERERERERSQRVYGRERVPLLQQQQHRPKAAAGALHLVSISCSYGTHFQINNCLRASLTRARLNRCFPFPHPHHKKPYALLILLYKPRRKVIF